MKIGYDATSAFCERETGNGLFSRMLLEALLENTKVSDIFAIYPERSLASPLSYSSRKIHFVPLKNWDIIDRHNACFDTVVKREISAEFSIKGLDFLFGPDFTLPYTKIPHVLTFHDFGFLKYPDMYPTTTVKHLSYLCKYEADNALGISFVSESMKKEFLHLFPHSNVITHIIPNVPKTMHLKKGVPVRKLPKQYILTVGDISPKKDQSTLVRALEILREKYKSDYNIVIVGRAFHNMETLIKTIKSLRLQDKVYIYQDINDDELPYIYKNAKLYVTCSLDEGFGLTSFEAITFNIPVIASDIPAHRETLKDSATFFSAGNETALAHIIYQNLKDDMVDTSTTLKAKKRLQYYSKNRFYRDVDTFLVKLEKKVS